jgi:acylphosphatase
MVAKRIIFTGTVQGVGFRFTANSIAQRYRLAGYVRNLHNGGVEMLVQGTARDIDDCLIDIGESFAGYIRDTKIEDLPTDPACTDFKITF